MDEEERMENQQQPQQEWTLQCSGLTIRQGDLIECEVAHQVRVATVKQVSVVGISMYGTRAGDQVVHVQLYKPARREGSGDRYVPATNVFRVLDAPPVPPAIVVELLYPKHAFHRYAKGKIHIVRHEITPLWGGPPVDRSKETLCGLPTAESQRLEERKLPREQVCGSCLRNVRLFRLPQDDWRRRGQYLREHVQPRQAL